MHIRRNSAPLATTALRQNSLPTAATSTVKPGTAQSARARSHSMSSAASQPRLVGAGSAQPPKVAQLYKDIADLDKRIQAFHKKTMADPFFKFKFGLQASTLKFDARGLMDKGRAMILGKADVDDLVKDSPAGAQMAKPEYREQLTKQMRTLTSEPKADATLQDMLAGKSIGQVLDLLDKAATAVKSEPAGTPKSNPDVRQLACNIVSGGADKRGADIEKLVQLANGPGPQGLQAQATLRDLHADPAAFAGSGGVANKEEIRTQLKAAASKAFEVALKSGGAGSVTVAYLAGCHKPANGPGVAAQAQTHIEKQITGNKVTIARGDKLLTGGRSVDEGELIRAAGSFSHLSMHPQVLNMSISSGSSEVASALFQNPLKELQDKVKTSNGPACHAAWIHTGDKHYGHWMQLVIKKDNAGKIKYDVLDTNALSRSGPRIKDALLQLLTNAGIEPDSITFHSANMQANVANGCGPLGYDMLKALDKELAKPEHEANGPDVSFFIETHTTQWAQLDANDQQAAVLSTRAELLSSWAGDVPAASSPASPGPVESQPLPPSLKQDLESLKFHRVIQTDKGKHYGSSFSAFGESYDAIGKLKGFGPQLEAIRKQPKGSQALTGELLNFERTVQQLQDSPLLGNYDRGLGKFSELGNTLIKQQLTQLTQQVSAKLKDVPSDLAKSALRMGPGSSEAERQSATHLFKQQAAGISGEMASLTSRVDKAIELLQEVVKAYKNDYIDQALSSGESFTINDRQVHADAQKLLARLLPLQVAMKDPEGPLQQLSKFAETASRYPSEVAATLRQQIASAPERVLEKSVENRPV